MEDERERWALLCFQMLAAITELEKSAERWQRLFEQSEALRSDARQQPTEVGFDERYPMVSRWVN